MCVWFVVVVMLRLPLPSNVPLPVTEPVKAIVRAVANLVAVAALPDDDAYPTLYPKDAFVTFDVGLLATNVPG